MSTGLRCSRVRRGAPLARRHACAPMIAQDARRKTATQNGKNPLCGPSVPQPTPRRSESQMTRRPPAIRINAVVRSAVRTSALRRLGLLLLEEPPLLHELAVHLV